MSRYRIILNNLGLYEIEKKGSFGWTVIKEDIGCDPLGYDYSYFSKTFTTIEDAESYINKLKNKFTKIVVKEL